MKFQSLAGEKYVNLCMQNSESAIKIHEIEVANEVAIVCEVCEINCGLVAVIQLKLVKLAV